MQIFYYLFLVAVAAACVRALSRPGVAMALILLLWVIKQGLQAKIGIFAANSAYANFILAGVAGVCWLRLFAKTRGIVRYPQPLFALTLLFFFLLLAATLWAPDPQYAIKGWIANGPYVILFVIFFPGLLTRESDLPQMFRAFVGLGLITTIAFLLSLTWQGRGIAFEAGGLSWASDAATFRYQMGSPLETAAMGMRMILIVLLLNSQNAGTLFSAVRWGVVLISTALMLKSGTRGNVIALAPTLLIFLPLSKEIKNARSFFTLMVTIVGLAAVAFWVVSYASTSARWTADVISRDSGVRTHLVTASLDAWLHSGVFRFLFGFGYDGSFLPDLDIGFPEFGPAGLLIDTGLFGVIIYLLIIGYGVRSWMRCFKLTAGNPVSRGYLAILGAFPFAQWLTMLKGSGYWQVLPWCVFIAQYERILAHAEQSLPAELGGAETPELIHSMPAYG